MNMDAYFRATPDERAQIDKHRPPATQTHRGKALSWEMRGYADSQKPKRTPTHRTPGAPVTPAWTRNLLAAIGKAPDNA